MKKLLSTLLCLAVIIAALGLPASAADTGGFIASNVKSVRLSAPFNFTQEVFCTEVGARQQAQVFLASAGKAVTKPANATEIAKLEVSGDSGAQTYSLVSSGTGYYLAQGAKYRPVEYNDFETLVRSIDGIYGTVSRLDTGREAKFYLYAPVPGASNGGKILAIAEHSYTYMRVNGKFASRSSSFNMEAPTFSSSDGKLVTPEFYFNPEGVTYTVYRNGVEKAVWAGNAAQALTQKLDSGDYTVWAKASYNSDYYRGSVTYLYNLAVEPAKPVEISIEASHAQPGEVVVLRVSGPDAAKAMAVATTDVGFTPKFFRQNNTNQVALLPVSVYTTPGTHSVNVTCGDYSTRLSFTVKEKKFEVQQLTVAASTAEETILSQQANAEYEKVVAPLRTVSDNARYWDGRFILPTSDEKVTSSFGIIRYVNGSSSATRHNALDLAVAKGTSVKASGAGRILYAGFLQLTGNTVIIEHGYGLKTWYYHMDTLKVKTDQMVPQGGIIGTVGSTGFSTGPHMHFGMSVNNVFINPYTLIKTDLLAKEPEIIVSNTPASTFSLKLNELAYTTTTKTILGTLTNTGKVEDSYGLAYRIDRWTGSAWQKVPLNFNVNSIAVIVAPGDTSQVTFVLYPDQYKYTAGKYRVVMTDGTGNATAEFTLK